MNPSLDLQSHAAQVHQVFLALPHNHGRHEVEFLHSPR